MQLLTYGFQGKTASMAAAELGANQCLIKLIEYGCDVGQVDNNQFDTLCYCLVDQTEHHLECLRTCLNQDEQVYKNSMSLLKAWYALRYKHEQILDQLLDHILDQKLDQMQDLMRVFRIKAIEKGEEGLVYAKEILDKMSNPNQINYVNRRSALSYACEFNPSLVGDFMKKGADPNTKDVKGNTAVHFAAKVGAGEALQEMIARNYRYFEHPIFCYRYENLNF